MVAVFYDSLVFLIIKLISFFYCFGIGIQSSENAFTWFSVTDTQKCTYMIGFVNVYNNPRAF